MRAQIRALQENMQKLGIDWYIVPSEDFHHSEYVNEHFRMREFLSGFTGSAGTLLAGRQEAFLWTDGRYFLQAEAELSGSGITLMRAGQPDVPTLSEFLQRQADAAKSADAGRQIIGFDGRLISAKQASSFEEAGFSVLHAPEAAEDVWKDRPLLKPSPILPVSEESAGESVSSKLDRVRTAMKKQDADVLFLSDLTEIAWLLNLRGGDVECTPVFYAFLLLTQDSAKVYAMRTPEEDAGCYDGEGVPSDLPEDVTWHPYDQISAALSSVSAGSKVWLDMTVTGRLYADCVPDGAKILDHPSPVALMKAVKNPAEIDHTRAAHLRDGAAMAEFLCWLKSAVRTDGEKEETAHSLTEITAADHLLLLRRAQEGFLQLSFETISGYNEHGAIIHYAPDSDSDAALHPEGLLLVDSGGQYTDGTTDITRTIALGPLTDKMKEYYTLVLKAHIALARAVFLERTSGGELDVTARRPLQAHGLDFNHGTGHGVGHMLSVHEGPNNISKTRGGAAILPGMITTDEPGVYIEGEFGVRLENELLCVRREDGMLAFESLTLCPFDRDAILPGLLDPEELAWLNAYHARVLQKLEPVVSTEAAAWLRDACREL